MNDDRFSFRWGVPWLDVGFVQVPNCFFKHYSKIGVSVTEFAFILHLAAYKYESPQGYACPSLRTIAEQMGLTRRGVQKLRKSLEEEGWLTVHRRTGETSIYDFQAFALAMMRLEEIEMQSRLPGQGPGGANLVRRGGEPQFAGGANPSSQGGANPSSQGGRTPVRPNKKQETEKKEKKGDPDPLSRIPIWELGGKLQDIGINQEHGIVLIEKYGAERIEEVLTAVSAQGEKVRGRAAWVVAALRRKFVFSAPGVPA